MSVIHERSRLTVHPAPSLANVYPAPPDIPREIPAGAVRLRIRPDGQVVEE